MGSLGVKVENNLLSIDLSQMDFEIEELQTIMEKYRLKKKYHRLQDGSFLELENSSVVKFIAGITDGIDVDYRQIEKGKLKLPLYRSMYLERMLENLKNTSIVKDVQYKELIQTSGIFQDMYNGKLQ